MLKKEKHLQECYLTNFCDKFNLREFDHIDEMCEQVWAMIKITKEIKLREWFKDTRF